MQTVSRSGLIAATATAALALIVTAGLAVVATRGCRVAEPFDDRRDFHLEGLNGGAVATGQEAGLER